MYFKDECPAATLAEGFTEVHAEMLFSFLDGHDIDCEEKQGIVSILSRAINDYYDQKDNWNNFKNNDGQKVRNKVYKSIDNSKKIKQAKALLETISEVSLLTGESSDKHLQLLLFASALKWEDQAKAAKAALKNATASEPNKDTIEALLKIAFSYIETTDKKEKIRAIKHSI